MGENNEEENNEEANNEEENNEEANNEEENNEEENNEDENNEEENNEENNDAGPCQEEREHECEEVCAEECGVFGVTPKNLSLAQIEGPADDAECVSECEANCEDD